MAKLIMGMETNCVRDISSLLEDVYSKRLNFVCVPLFHPRFRRDSFGISDKRKGPLTRSDMVLESKDWTSSVVGVISPYLNFDSNCAHIRKSSEQMFKEELAWATHLSIPAVILPAPALECANYAQMVNQVAISATYMQLWIRVPLHSSNGSSSIDDDAVSEKSACSPVSSVSMGISSNSNTKDEAPWEGWNNLRSMCEYSPSIGVALEITADLPSREVIDRWLGEPIRALILPTSIFLTNRKGFPTLSQRHQQILHRFFKFKIQIILKGRSRHHGQLLAYQQYVEYLYSKRSQMSQQDAFESPYQDYLQSPLQPLMDNLESQTYETFERDPIKYSQYEAAVRGALLDTPPNKESVIMVVGAGRGPLVRASLRAAQSASRKVRIYAVEKNSNAVITLRNMKIQENMENVTIVSSDMRVWDAPEQADILVSELLGSFGDNELSPECLDGAQKFLKPDGISIPCKYTSYISPISTSKLWNEVKAMDTQKSFETAYVVRLHNFHEIAPSQECFEFHHPNRDEKIDNRRYTKRTFQAKTGSILHGFAGYFHAQLYKDVYISIDPATFSEGMFSWFPLFIPLKTPIYVPANHSIEVHFWRKVSSTKVWYEWTARVEEQNFSPIHNPNGRSYWIGL